MIHPLNPGVRRTGAGAGSIVAGFSIGLFYMPSAAAMTFAAVRSG